MLTFYRQIRKGLLDIGKARKYLLYAIGEIVLVVIGILIALQINNWNENRKSLKLEREYLIEIRENLQIDLAALQSLVEHHRDDLKYILWCIDHLSGVSFKKEKFSENYIEIYSGNPTFFPRDGGYTSLTASGGVNLIRNKSLASTITDLYEHWYQRLIYNGEFLDQRLDNFHKESSEYFLIDQRLFYVEDIQNTDILADMNYLARPKRFYVTRAEETLDVLIELLGKMNEVLGS